MPTHEQVDVLNKYTDDYQAYPTGKIPISIGENTCSFGSCRAWKNNTEINFGRYALYSA